MAQYRARPDLDLSDILPSYQEFLGASTADINYVSPKGKPQEYEDYEPYQEQGWEPIPSRLYASYRDSEEPFLDGSGPVACSTSRVVALRRPTFAWDGNFYYRRLGIPFPYVNATQGALSRAYMAGDQHNPLAMYALKRLLDPAVREMYDALPLGEVDVDDIYFQQWLKARAMAEAGRRTAMGDDTEASQVLDEWGYKTEPDDDKSLDTVADNVQDEIAHRQEEESTVWSYSYWVWRSRWSADRASLMERWQSLLVSALSEAGCTVSLTVGILGRQPHPYVVQQSSDRRSWVVYLNEAEQPEEVAERAARALRALITEHTEH